MRVREVASAFLLASCTCAEPAVHTREAGADAEPAVHTREAGADVGPIDPPPVEREGRLYVATLPSGAEHVVRVEADGTAAPWGPPLPSSVGRMLQSADARRVLVQDNVTRTTHALHGDRWAPICGGLGAERCYATSPRADLGVFLAQRSYDDTSGVLAALLSYGGDRLAPSDGRIAVHSDLGWSVLTELPRTFVRARDGTTHDLPMLDGELPARPVGSELLTAANDYQHVWLRDPVSGARTELTCPDGRAPIELWSVGAEAVCCGGTAHRLLETGLAPTAHRCEVDALGELRLEHLEDGAYLVTRREHERTAALSFVAPEGRVIAALARDYPPDPTPASSYASLRVTAFRASRDRFVAYVVLRHFLVVDDDIELLREEGVLVLDVSAAVLDWHPVEATDAPTYRVWFPSSAERALWVTPDGRLVSFELDTRALVDRTGSLRFHAGIDGS